MLPPVDDSYILKTLIDLLKWAGTTIVFLMGVIWAQLNVKINKGQADGKKSNESMAASIATLTEKVGEKVSDLDRRQIHSEIYIGELKRRFSDIEHDATGKHCSTGDNKA